MTEPNKTPRHAMPFIFPASLLIILLACYSPESIPNGKMYPKTQIPNNETNYILECPKDLKLISQTSISEAESITVNDRTIYPCFYRLHGPIWDMFKQQLQPGDQLWRVSFGLLSFGIAIVRDSKPILCIHTLTSYPDSI